MLPKFLRHLLPLALLGLTMNATAADDTSPINSRFMLMNHYGEMVTDRDFGDRYQLIYFGYTYCPDVCPSALMVVTQALKLLGDDAKRIQPLFISVDPQRDTPQVLREYVAYFHPSIVGLTGSPELIARTAANFRVTYQKVVVPGMPPDQYQMDHTAGGYLIAPDGRFLVKFAHGMLPKDMAARIKDFL